MYFPDSILFTIKVPLDVVCVPAKIMLSFKERIAMFTPDIGLLFFITYPTCEIFRQQRKRIDEKAHKKDENIFHKLFLFNRFLSQYFGKFLPKN